MNQKEIKELIELLVEKDITEFELQRGDIKVHVKREARPLRSSRLPLSSLRRSHFRLQ